VSETTLSPDGQSLRRQDVGLIAVFIGDQRNEGGPVRIVFQTLDGRLDAKLAALEVDDAVGALVTAAATTRR
jgi:hypothetical protein